MSQYLEFQLLLVLMIISTANAEILAQFYQKESIKPMKEFPTISPPVRGIKECSTYCLIDSACMYFTFNETTNHCSLYNNYTSKEGVGMDKVVVYVNTNAYNRKKKTNSINCTHEAIKYRPEQQDEILGWHLDCEFEGDIFWVFIQRRIDGVVNFTRSWQEYKDGFGDVKGEFWLGNEKIFNLTKDGNTKVKFEMWDEIDNYGYAQYDSFELEGEDDDFALNLHTYSGTAGDEMMSLNDIKFSTFDRDNDNSESHCVIERGMGGWWFNNCESVTLNGLYLTPGTLSPDGIKWPQFSTGSLRKSQIKLALLPPTPLFE